MAQMRKESNVVERRLFFAKGTTLNYTRDYFFDIFPFFITDVNTKEDNFIYSNAYCWAMQ
jgi:hypothetical protein